MHITDYTIRVRLYDPSDLRLGRHVRHDSRSLQYQYPEADARTLVSKKHLSFIPVLDQGNLGSCTGNAAVKAMSYDPLWSSGGLEFLSPDNGDGDEDIAISVYSDATKIDSWDGEYPPTDTGSDGLSVAKVLKNRGLISGYQHATSMNALLNALQDQSVIVGTEWRNNMFYPDSDGRLHITGSVAGGHEYCLDQIDVENERVWVQNSWGNSWGVNGRAYLTWDDMTTLLSADGDCTIFTPLTAPAPTPTPPAPVPASEVDSALVNAVSRWIKKKRFWPCNEAVRQALIKWKTDKNL